MIASIRSAGFRIVVFIPSFPKTALAASICGRKPAEGGRRLVQDAVQRSRVRPAEIAGPGKDLIPQGQTEQTGIAGTWFTIDPTHDGVFVGMIRRMMGPGMPNLEVLSRPLIYQALIMRPGRTQ
jgi:CubicO group peptidase (beta-lactamase class C family)